MKTKPPLTFSFSVDVYEAIRATVGRRPAETGGMLGGDLKTGRVTHFYFDEVGECNGAAYAPDIASLNKLLKDDWNQKNVRLLGFVHSHPRDFYRPSVGDEEYANNILASNPELPALLVPIVQPAVEGGSFRLDLFVAERTPNGVKMERVALTVSEMESKEAPAAKPQNQDKVPKTEHTFEACSPLFVDAPTRGFDRELFTRVVNAYDLNHLAQCRVVWIGVGGAVPCLEDLARAGVGEFVLIDPGLVEKCNLATQQYYRSDIGMPKVECIRKRLREINSDAAVECFPKSLHEIDDEFFAALLERRPVEGHNGTVGFTTRNTFIVGCTDDFYAQARVNRLALNFGLPSVCAQLYDQSYGGEVTFTHPVTTKACHRCILSSRYRAYLKENYRNPVGSAGSPICSTGRINALTTTVLLTLMHHGTDHPRWGGLLERVGTRNLALTRNHPDLEEFLGLRNFSQALAGATSAQLFFDETIWRPQLPEHPSTGYARPCPDCGGGGDLASCKGTFADTRVMIPEP